jgi:hypothetical protein
MSPLIRDNFELLADQCVSDFCLDMRKVFSRKSKQSTKNFCRISYPDCVWIVWKVPKMVCETQKWCAKHIKGKKMFICDVISMVGGWVGVI